MSPKGKNYGTQIREALWQQHIADNTDGNGVWVSTSYTRSQLPNAQYYGSSTISSLLARMARDGLIENIGLRGHYRVPKPEEAIAPVIDRLVKDGILSRPTGGSYG